MRLFFILLLCILAFKMLHFSKTAPQARKERPHAHSSLRTNENEPDNESDNQIETNLDNLENNDNNDRPINY
jgi:hypothetical protein